MLYIHTPLRIHILICIHCKQTRPECSRESSDNQAIKRGDSACYRQKHEQTCKVSSLLAFPQATLQRVFQGTCIIVCNVRRRISSLDACVRLPPSSMVRAFRESGSANS